MTGFTDKNNRLFAENVALDAIAAEFGTPTYVYSAGHIRAQYHRLRRVMEKMLPRNRQPLLCYACKANSNLAILSLLKKEGCGLEVVSEGELRRGLRAGFDPQKIVSTGLGKSKNEIIALLTAGVLQINVESLPEIDRIDQIAAQTGIRAKIAFRLNPDVAGGGNAKISTGQKHDKFGLSAEDVLRAYEKTAHMENVEAVGISTHIGSQVFTVESFREAFQKIPGIVKDLRAAGHTVSRLDIGGGFPLQYNKEILLDLEKYAEWVRDFIVPLDTQIIMEPGRFFVGNGAVLLSEVTYVKETAERTFLVLDAGMNDLIRPAMYDSWHNIEPVNNRSARPVVYDVVGPVCESSDFFAKDRSIPAMKEGDLAVIRSAGAYGFSMASHYNSRLMPAEVLVDGDHVALIRERETYDDMLAKDVIPPWVA